MKITTIPQIYRHLNRWREILTVLSRYGLANWIGHLGPDFAKDILKTREGTAIARHRWETRVRMAISELGPTFIKLGQILSTRPDLVGVTLAEELQQLQTNVSADAPEIVRTLVESEFGRSLDELFDHFDPKPIASASIGQVHRARLKTGEYVAVKVLHADIERKITVDSDILSGLAQMAEMIPEFQSYRPRALADEFQRTIRRELDFNREARNIQQFSKDFARDRSIHIPRVYLEFSTSRVLTMEYIEGIKLSEPDRLAAAGINLEEVAKRGANMYLEMIFGHSFFHADPHPGNVVLMSGGVIGLLDFGMVGRLDERLHEDIGDMLMALASLDAEYLTAILIRVGAVPSELDRSALSLEVADFVAHYGNQPMGEFDLSGALKEMVELIRRFRISLPPRIAMLIKVLVTLEGTSRLLSPRFSLLEVMRPYRRKMMLRRLSPGRRLRKLRRFFSGMEHLVDVLPQGLLDIMEQIQSGKFDVHLDHRGLEPSVNRLVAGMLASALFLGSAFLLGHGFPPVLQGVSIPGLLGCSVSIGLGLRLWRAISKSGHLDRRR
jgi:ubiquinone biosynthesis protein